jgi:nonspecific dipeptidase
MGSKDLHSGVFGGTVREALPDLIWLLDQLVDSTGTIQIPGMLDDVCPLLPEEEQIYKNIEFDLEDFKTDAGLLELRFPGNKVLYTLLQDTFHFIVKKKLFYKHFLLFH